MTILSAFKVAPLIFNTLMPAIFPIPATLLKYAFLYCQQLLFRFSSISSILAKHIPFIGVFSFGEEEKINGGQVR